MDVLTFVSGICGILAGSLFLIVFYHLAKKHNLDLNKDPVSHLAEIPEARRRFRLFLGFCFFLQFAYVFQLLNALEIFSLPLRMVFLIAAIGGILSSVFTPPYHSLKHIASIGFMLIFSTLGIGIMGIFNVYNNIYLSMISVIVFIGVMLTIAPYVVKNRTLSGKQEFIFVTWALLWSASTFFVLFLPI